MTAFFHSRSSFLKHRRPRAGQLCFGLFGVFCLLLLLKNSELAISYMNRGLLLCARTIVPSLFPFLVLSELLVSGDAASHLPKPLLRPLEKLFGLPADGCIAVLLGAVCGFPVGAKCTVLAYRKGTLSQEEAERVLCFSNNPSSAFLISAVGVSLFANRSFGIVLYAVTLSVSLIVGILLSLLQKKNGEPKEKTDPLFRDPPFSNAASLDGAKLFTSSIRSATESILLVCAYVIFFSTLVGTLRFVPDALSLPTELHALLFCLFEISSGMSVASTLGSTQIAACLCAFCAGWSGLSVHCQILSVCDGCGFSFRRYALSKLLQGLLCALIFSLVIHFMPELLIPARIVSTHL